MEAIGKLTGGITHMFNNLLQVNLGDGDMMETRVAESDGAAALRGGAIMEVANRRATLTQ